MNTCMHFMHPPKVVQIGWGHHVNFCVWKKSAITFGEGCMLYTVSLNQTVTIPHCLYHISIYIFGGTIYLKYITHRKDIWNHKFILRMLICMRYGVKWISVMELFVTCQQNTEKGEVWCDIISVVNNGSANGLSPAGTKPSPALILISCQLDLLNKLHQNSKWNSTFSVKTMHSKMSSAKWSPRKIKQNITKLCSMWYLCGIMYL